MRKRDNKTSPNRILYFPAENEFVMSRLDAERALKRDGYPSIDQIFDRARTKVDWPDAVWVELEAAASLSNKASSQKGNNDDNFTCFWHSHRRLAMVCSVILIIGTTVAVVPETRAFAMRVYEAVIRIFDNRAEVQQPEQNYIDYEYNGEIVEEFSSSLGGESAHENVIRVFANIRELEEETGYIPYVLDPERFTYDAIRFIENARSEKWLYIYYSYNDGTIATTQIWDSVDNIISTADDQFSEFLLDDGRVVYYAVDDVDQSKFGMVRLAASTLIISSDSVLPMDEFLALFS